MVNTQIIRDFAEEKYVRPWRRRSSKRELSIPVREVFDEMVRRGLPRARIPMVCNALRAGAFLKHNHLEIVAVEGPPSQQSSTVIFHYADANKEAKSQRDKAETSQEWAERVTRPLAGFLKEDLKEFGGAEGFIQWLRSDEDAA